MKAAITALIKLSLNRQFSLNQQALFFLPLIFNLPSQMSDRSSAQSRLLTKYQPKTRFLQETGFFRSDLEVLQNWYSRSQIVDCRFSTQLAIENLKSLLTPVASYLFFPVPPLIRGVRGDRCDD